MSLNVRTYVQLRDSTATSKSGHQKRAVGFRHRTKAIHDLLIGIGWKEVTHMGLSGTNQAPASSLSWSVVLSTMARVLMVTLTVPQPEAYFGRL